MAPNSPQKRPLGAQISHMLKDRGVDTIFGIPGVHNQEMYRGLQEAGITHVLARHEQGAGFMADGYARATGLPGVAYVITGPGLCNIMTPMGQAYSDSVPMLVISSCLDETSATRGQLHQMKDQRAAAETVCDWSQEARSPQAVYQLIDRALIEFDTQRARPKHLQVPISLLQGTAAPDWPAAGPPVLEALDTTPASPPSSLPASTQVAPALAAAKRPIIIFGGGAADMTCANVAAHVMEKFGAAAFTSYAGRGVVAAGHPLLFGSYLARAGSAEVLAQADLVLAIGTSLDEVDLWRGDLGHHCPLWRVDMDPEVLSDGHHSTHKILMDAGLFLNELAMDTARGGASDWTAAQVTAARAKWRAEVEAEYAPIPRIADALRACLPEGTMIYSDMTQFAYAAKELWDMDQPAHWHHPNGFGTLGYALPAAIGGAIARPGLPTLAIAGDYGFHYTCQELGVAVELGLPLPIILWDNGKLGAIEASMVGAQIAPNAVVARNPDFVKLAEAFGAGATTPATLEEMQQTVQAAFTAHGPTLIHLTPDITR